MQAPFDPLKFYDELKAADVPEKQARIQAETLRQAFASYDASRMRELATKGDLRDVRHELENRILALESRILRWMGSAIIVKP